MSQRSMPIADRHSPVSPVDSPEREPNGDRRVLGATALPYVDEPVWDAKVIAASHFQALQSALGCLDLGALERVVEHLRRARDRGATIYVAGNGGSAATALHWTNDLGKATKRSGRAPLRVVSLVDNVSWLTALANDEGYERVFAGQLENFARPGDILVVISASGNSPNLLRAVELAAARELTTIGFLGFDGGALKGMVDEYLWIPSESGAYELVEDGHATICHALTICLVRDRPWLTSAV